MTKRYNLISAFKLATTVNVNGEQQRIIFEGGNKFNGTINGYFLTDNKDVQDALESDNAYGSEWELDPSCVESNEVEETVVPGTDPVATTVQSTETVVPPVEPVTETVVPVTEEAKTEEPVKNPTDDITNYTEAKIYIHNLFPEVTRTEIISSEKLREYAKAKGITFANWTE